MAEPIEMITLHVPRSPDGETEFARVADILDCLAVQYGWHPYVAAYLAAQVNDLRKIDQVMSDSREVCAVECEEAS